MKRAVPRCSCRRCSATQRLPGWRQGWGEFVPGGVRSRSSSGAAVRPVKSTARCSPASTGRPGGTLTAPAGEHTHRRGRHAFFPSKPLPRRWPKRRRDAPVLREPLSGPGRQGAAAPHRDRGLRPRPPGSGVRPEPLPRRARSRALVPLPAPPAPDAAGGPVRLELRVLQRTGGEGEPVRAPRRSPVPARQSGPGPARAPPPVGAEAEALTADPLTLRV